MHRVGRELKLRSSWCLDDDSLFPRFVGLFARSSPLLALDLSTWLEPIASEGPPRIDVSKKSKLQQDGLFTVRQKATSEKRTCLHKALANADSYSPKPATLAPVTIFSAAQPKSASFAVHTKADAQDRVALSRWMAKADLLPSLSSTGAQAHLRQRRSQGLASANLTMTPGLALRVIHQRGERATAPNSAPRADLSHLQEALKGPCDFQPPALSHILPTSCLFTTTTSPPPIFTNHLASRAIPTEHARPPHSRTPTHERPLHILIHHGSELTASSDRLPEDDESSEASHI